MQERSISISQFVQSRSVEIANFLKSLADKALAKRSYQALPKSIRRRAMSHNRYRIPSRLRANINQQLKLVESTQKIPRCRKSIRRRPDLYKAYKQRDKKCRWLSTHLWAVKRMRMKEYFGYKVAVTPNDKSTRACYRFSNYTSCILDMSYYESMLLEFDSPQTLFRVVQKHITSPLLLSKQCTFTQFLNSSQQVICPVYILPGPKSTSAVVIYHPAASPEFQQLVFQGCTRKQIYKNRIQIFRLLGPESLTRLSQLIQQLGVTPSADIQRLLTDKNPSHFNKNEIIQVLNSQTPTHNLKDRMISNPTRLYTSYVRTEYNKSYNADARKRLLEQIKAHNQHLQQIISEEHKPLGFWDTMDYEPKYEPKFDLVTRSRYTHKRKKIQKAEKQKILDEAYKIKEEKIATNTLLFEQALKKEILKHGEKSKGPVVQTPSKIVIVETPSTIRKKNEAEPSQTAGGRMFVTLFNDNNKLDGCLIFTTDFSHNYIWRKLVFLNCKVIGLEDLRRIQTENGIRTYPEDYPQTQGYQVNLKESIRLNIKRFKYRPPSKSVNYKVIHSPFPFGPSFGSLCRGPFAENFIPVRLLMVGRGTMPENSYICLPIQEDLIAFRHMILVGGSIKHICEEEQDEQAMLCEDRPDSNQNASTQLKKKQDLRKLEDAALIKEFKHTMTSRRVIGFVTSGGYSLHRAKGFGIGNVMREYDYYDYVLVRKPTSVHYFMATVSRIES